MKNNNCEIVKDLIPNYIENQISEVTKDFIENHIKECNECKIILESLIREKNKEKIADKKEINFLKKYNRKINILKIIAIILSTIILILWGIMVLEYIEKKQCQEKAEKIFNIIEQSYYAINEVQKDGNYSLKDDCIEYENGKILSENILEYKDKYFKEQCISQNVNYTNYGIQNSRKCVYTQFWDDYELEENNTINYNITNIGYQSNLFANYRTNIDNLLYNDYEIKDKKINNINYYVISGNNTEIWINKENMLPYKMKNYYENGIISERQCLWNTEEVKDEDVRLENEQKYNELNKFMNID